MAKPKKRPKKSRSATADRGRSRSTIRRSPQKSKKQLTKGNSTPSFASVGEVARTISVGLSYKIVELFSEGLYASANKAFEELVTNSFDAGARNVQVVLPSDPTIVGSTIIVVDDGESMDIEGLEELWQIGVSNKRSREDLPLGRNQIGKFGIGKLSTYVLANELTHICKCNRISMPSQWIMLN
ncbi:MAG: ATP-binding protein [Deltaproteobacteria bacterium]|nr:ATP-binding protein [Deltaproteobacteria bacterium]